MPLLPFFLNQRAKHNSHRQCMICGWNLIHQTHRSEGKETNHQDKWLSKENLKTLSKNINIQLYGEQVF